MADSVFDPHSKRSRTPPKFYGFHTFAEPGCPAAAAGAFRDNIRHFLQECAEPEDYDLEGMPIWRTFLVYESRGTVLPLYTVEENVERSDRPLCDYCSCAGWSHHFVSKRKYHFIIPAIEEWNDPLEEGVMVAADSRASMGGYISSQSVKKMIEISPYMLGIFLTNKLLNSLISPTLKQSMVIAFYGEFIFGYIDFSGIKPGNFSEELQFDSKFEIEPENVIFVGVESPNYENFECGFESNQNAPCDEIKIDFDRVLKPGNCYEYDGEAAESKIKEFLHEMVLENKEDDTDIDPVCEDEAVLNSAVFSDGSFVYVPKNRGLQRAALRLSWQFERTLIVADEGSFVEYLEGCTAPSCDTNQLHAAVVELYCHAGAEIKYSAIQNLQSKLRALIFGALWIILGKRVWLFPNMIETDMNADMHKDSSEKEILDNFFVEMIKEQPFQKVEQPGGGSICLKILEKMLRNCHYEVTRCNRTEAALKLLRDNKDGFDIVISDVHMLDMDGFKLLEQVGLEMDLPVIMMSADDSKNLVMKGVTHGACDYLIKPVRMEVFKNIWQHVVRKRKDKEDGNKFVEDIQNVGEVQEKIHISFDNDGNDDVEAQFSVMERNLSS